MLLIFMKTICNIFAFTQSHIPITERIWRTSKFEGICRKRRHPAASSFSVLSDLQKRRCDLSSTDSLKPKWRFKSPVTSSCNLQLFAWNVVLLTDDRPTSLHFLMRRFANGTKRKKQNCYIVFLIICCIEYIFVFFLLLYLTRKNDILVKNVLFPFENWLLFLLLEFTFFNNRNKDISRYCSVLNYKSLDFIMWIR